MDWRAYSGPMLRGVAGYIAEGADDHYLVTATCDGRYLLCRWRRDAPTNLEALREAASTTVEVEGYAAGRAAADRYERGDGGPPHPAWMPVKS